MQDVATPQVTLLPTGLDLTTTSDVTISIIRILVCCPSQGSQPLELKIGAVRDTSASALDVRVGFGTGSSLRETYEYTLNPPLPFMKDPIVKQLAKYIRRSHYMFRLHHGPDLLSHALFVSESTDQIEALAYKLVDRGRTDHAAWTEQTSRISNTSPMPELPPAPPIDKECAGTSSAHITSCRTLKTQSTFTVRHRHAYCDGKCMKHTSNWFCVSQSKLCR